MSTELPTYEEAQTLSLDPASLIKSQQHHPPLSTYPDHHPPLSTYPESPPPSWSPPHAVIHVPPNVMATPPELPPETQETTEVITNQQSAPSVADENNLALTQQPVIYQLFGRTSPNRVHRKFKMAIDNIHD